jgi:hypothetical protein
VVIQTQVAGPQGAPSAPGSLRGDTRSRPRVHAVSVSVRLDDAVRVAPLWDTTAPLPAHASAEARALHAALSRSDPRGYVYPDVKALTSVCPAAWASAAVAGLESGNNVTDDDPFHDLIEYENCFV